ncbi:taurine ABC transporter substrate-binding protein [Paenirhodobacter populi]|uniref:Taurine ABC transporter substrate-binding protein n=1 Tax=Paenirhodobacter populi TaxID=2306993 RepID=A0A443JAI2_9RHOB|nr:ABC transporter substrate-binding protein [Sinirhodobacter populi]RWR05229.1 taurine ABC transporter substrate-binding protein [Sinirhodobacter populi]RWR17464.1 taurine ABC transporter substrate-binding protein [Sinirhodobacter populi]RWR27366.1 taurine ABC transporter substrate-binding protein [Sinirhodobacter populi]
MTVKSLSSLFGLVVAFALPAQAGAANKVVIAYQTGAEPYFAGIATGEIARSFGPDWEVEFRRFNSGADIFAAISSGSVQIGAVGSSPYAAVASRGLDVKGIYVTAAAGESEALVVRKDIASSADLVGKKLSAAPVSTDHYQLLAYLKQEGLSEKDTQVIAIPQPEIVAAWKRGDIDGAFVWDPALAELKKDGKVLVTSGEVSERGAPVFTAFVATGDFIGQHPDFLKKFVGLIDGYSVDFVQHPENWGVDSEYVTAIARLQGGTPEEIVAWNASIVTVPLAEQGTAAWLGGGADGAVARTLKDTAAFLKEQKKITAVLDDYSPFVDPQFVDALKVTN